MIPKVVTHEVFLGHKNVSDRKKSQGSEHTYFDKTYTRETQSK